MAHIFYTYMYLRYNGTPYYVGKGTGDRATRYSRGHVPPANPELILIEPHESESDAFEAEKLLIAYYGRINLGTGCLKNLTEGGEGSAGAVRSPAFRQNVSVHLSRRVISESTRKKLSIAKSQRVVTDATRKKLSIIGKGRKLSEESIRKSAESRIGRTVPEETRAKIRASNLGQKRSPEFCRQASDRMKRTAATEEGRRRILYMLAQPRHVKTGPKKGTPWSEARRLAQLRKSTHAARVA